MASIAEINVRIGARIEQMVKGLNKAENHLRRSSRKLSQLGEDMTKTISLPIIGIGAAAIKSAGDMEQLENGLTSIMGDAEAAAKELEKLKEAAQNPGLGFTQAVKGSVRLQSVGLNAETARKALLNFGNAIALAGGSATDLDGVSLALTQIISKGKISAEEINQLAERVPQVRKAIKDGFGTADSEELQKLGISAEEFVEKVVDEMGKLPQATGGIKNAITNAGIAIQVFLSDLGKDIDKTFDVQGMVKGFADTLQNLSERFKNLDASTKKAVLQFVALVVAIGPAIKIFGTLKNVYAGVISATSSMLGVMKGMSGIVLSAAASFQKLNMVMKVSVIGAVIAAATAAVVIFQKWNNTLSDTQKVQRELTDVNTKAAQSIVEEKIEVERLTAVLKDENATREEKKKALNELNEISPEYFGGLDIEKSKLEDVDIAQKQYINNLLRMAKVQAAKERIVELNKELLDTNGILDKTKPGFDNFEAGIIRFTKVGEERTQALGKVWAKEAIKYKGSLEQQIDLLMQMILQEESLLKKRETFVENHNPVIRPVIPKQPQTSEKTKNKSSETNEEQLLEPIQREIVQLEELEMAYIEATLAKENLFKPIEGVESVSKEEETPIAKWRKDLEELANSTEEFEDVLYKTINAIDQYAKQGGQSFKDMGKSALKAAADVVRAKMQEAVAAYISSKIALGPLGLLLAATGGAVVGTLFSKALSSLKIPALAKGGLAFGPTMAVVGDNPNSVLDPEVIAPLSKLKNMISDGMGGMNNMVLSARVSGNDLLFILKNANMNEQRVTGTPAFVTG